ncbi:hypothetical protein JQ628_33540 [Bradyrhizobium lablabi]|uniref:hypothetical protein n=1 Tax=Bradyrhizobium lablabi TaxID=722472 RepID=UPI001BADC584|nr:hypothetical protein [Bradyrhizobium lablabi]MBR1126485.1 hypothetical protein [Bradyrhizobium lablabi]
MTPAALDMIPRTASACVNTLHAHIAARLACHFAFRWTKKMANGFSLFAFRAGALIDASILASLPSLRTDPLEIALGGRDDVFAAR